jgi:glycosyltransferase involved in cell wall biosynthesis
VKISVLIPAYNAAATIQATLDSVLCQTVPADEILAMDDGSSDETAAILRRYEPNVTTLSQPNSGVSSARNALIAKARGDLIAFLDSDDLWHPRYLETQRKLFELHPEAVALFIGHTSFTGLGSYSWESINTDSELHVEMFDPVSFLSRFRTAPGHFILSFCCFQKRIIKDIGAEPFKQRIAEDVYFCNLLPFWGPIAFAPRPLLGAYRGREGSLSSNRLHCAKEEVNAFQLLEEHYRNAGDARLMSEFEQTLFSKRRTYAKLLLSAGNTLEARRQLWRSLRKSVDPASLAKSIGLLSLSYLPRSLQPKWPPVDRPLKASELS